MIRIARPPGLLLATILLTGLAASPGPAWAQANALAPVGAPDGRSSAARRPTPERAPPAAIPGSRADSSLASPAEAARVDMPPNEALFDAINRGDITATKDAISRGADIQGHNVLGLTPLELSVDLGRNDISFLLLSLRGGAGYNIAGPARQSQTPAAPSRAQLAAERRAEQIAQRRQDEAARVANRAAVPAPPRNARLFAGDGGAPVPQAGFLGFEPAR